MRPLLAILGSFLWQLGPMAGLAASSPSCPERPIACKCCAPHRAACSCRCQTSLRPQPASPAKTNAEQFVCACNSAPDATARGHQVVIVRERLLAQAASSFDAPPEGVEPSALDVPTSVHGPPSYLICLRSVVLLN